MPRGVARRSRFGFEVGDRRGGISAATTGTSIPAPAPGVEIKQMAGPKFVGTESSPPIATFVGKTDYATDGYGR